MKNNKPKKNTTHSIKLSKKEIINNTFFEIKNLEKDLLLTITHKKSLEKQISDIVTNDIKNIASEKIGFAFPKIIKDKIIQKYSYSFKKVETFVDTEGKENPEKTFTRFFEIGTIHFIIGSKYSFFNDEIYFEPRLWSNGFLNSFFDIFYFSFKDLGNTFEKKSFLNSYFFEENNSFKEYNLSKVKKLETVNNKEVENKINIFYDNVNIIKNTIQEIEDYFLNNLLNKLNSTVLVDKKKSNIELSTLESLILELQEVIFNEKEITKTMKKRLTEELKNTENEEDLQENNKNYLNFKKEFFNKELMEFLSQNNATLKVLNGESTYERNSLTFLQREEYKNKITHLLLTDFYLDTFLKKVQFGIDISYNDDEHIIEYRFNIKYPDNKLPRYYNFCYLFNFSFNNKNNNNLDNNNLTTIDICNIESLFSFDNANTKKLLKNETFNIDVLSKTGIQTTEKIKMIPFKSVEKKLFVEKMIRKLFLN
jgi:hypothetical protein